VAPIPALMFPIQKAIPIVSTTAKLDFIANRRLATSIASKMRFGNAAKLWKSDEAGAGVTES
jgi:hypothetical protein